MVKKAPRFEEVPVKLTRAGDASKMNLEDALLRLTDAMNEVKEARRELKEAQRARVRALMGNPDQLDLGSDHT